MLRHSVKKGELVMRIFTKCAVIRAVKTMAQTSVALLGTGAMGILDVDWISLLSATALAGITSVLTSIATGLPECKGESRQ